MLDESPKSAQHRRGTHIGQGLNPTPTANLDEHLGDFENRDN
jgi:hypothetical protein